MKPTLKISETVINRLTNVQEPCLGNLFGVFYNKTQFIIGLCLNFDDENSQIVQHFPTEVELCGIFEFLHIRLKAQLPLVCSPDEDNIEDALQELRQHFEGKVAFHFQKQHVFLLENGINGISSDSTVGDLCRQTSNTDTFNKNSTILDVLHVDMFKKVSQEISTEAKKNHAPILCVDKKKYESLVMVLNLDALSMIHRNLPLRNVYEILVSSLYRNIIIIKRTILKHFQQSGGDHSKISYPEIFHFYAKECGHFITRVYAKNESDCSLERDRKKLHSRLLLPATHPVFRRSNKFLFKGENQNNTPLINPHDGLKPTTNGGDIALVKGIYKYYHYCQDRMDDNGWGCAYRSLQTLASWLYLQGYTDESINHQISLDQNNGLDLPNSGEDVASKGPELLNHFQTYGSPVMIGGGVLAHTILGVDYNRQTGNIKFLILDPHYTGGENLQIIQTKGWVGWKGPEFWDKTAYYNMCLPQVPRCV
ncbi:hypothetical protein Trydic_g20746 [Trypoxylus dichotomus]